MVGSTARRLPNNRPSAASSTPESKAMLLPEITITWVVPVTLNASSTSGGIPLSMPSNMPLANAAAGSGRTRLSSADPRARTPYRMVQKRAP